MRYFQGIGRFCDIVHANDIGPGLRCENGCCTAADDIAFTSYELMPPL